VAEKIAAGPPVNVDLSTHFRLSHFVQFTAPPFQLRYKNLLPKEVLGSAEKIAAGRPVNVDLSTHFRLSHFVRFTAPPFQLRYKSTDWDYPDNAVHGLDTPTGFFAMYWLEDTREDFTNGIFSGLQA
jgi:hypothetical protein